MEFFVSKLNRRPFELPVIRCFVWIVWKTVLIPREKVRKILKCKELVDKGGEISKKLDADD